MDIRFDLEKELFLNKKIFLDKLIEENDNKNVVFFKYNGEIFTLKFKITKAYCEKLKKTLTIKTFNLLFIKCFFQHQ